MDSVTADPNDDRMDGVSAWWRPRARPSKHSRTDGSIPTCFGFASPMKRDTVSLGTRILGRQWSFFSPREETTTGGTLDGGLYYETSFSTIGSRLDTAPRSEALLAAAHVRGERHGSMATSGQWQSVGPPQEAERDDERHAGTSRMEDQHRHLAGDIMVVQDPDGKVYSMAALPDGLSEQLNQRKAQRVAEIRRLAEESFRRSQERSQQRYERFYAIHAWIFIVMLSLDLSYVIMLSALSFSRDSSETFGGSGVVRFFVPIYSTRKAIFALLGTVLINVFGAYGSATRSRGFLTFVMYANIAMAVFLLLESFAFEPFIKIILVLYAFYLRCIMIMLEDNVYNFSWAMLSPSVDSLLRRIGMVDSPPIVTVEVPEREPVGDALAATGHQHMPENEMHICVEERPFAEDNLDIESQVSHVNHSYGMASDPRTAASTGECPPNQNLVEPLEDLQVQGSGQRAQEQLGIVVDDEVQPRESCRSVSL